MRVASKLFSILALILFISSCSNNKTIDIQGHRGCRGLLPENSIPAFIKAIDLGVTTLDLDVVITRDRKVLVSNEAYISAEICLDEFGFEISESYQNYLNTYRMTYTQVKNYNCGSKQHPLFPEQEKVSLYKPLLADVIDTVEAYIKLHKLKPVNYNIEIRSAENTDQIFHPKPDTYSKLVMDVIASKGIIKKTSLQSLDVRTLQYLHSNYPKMQLGLIVNNNEGLEQNLTMLGFIPNTYSPNYTIVDKKLIKKVHQKEMRIVPWTVNSILEIEKLIDWQVDGLTTDYPNLIEELYP